MVTALALTFFTVTIFPALVVLTTTLPNDKLVGENVSGALAPPLPVPDNGAFSGLKAALYPRVSAPLMAPFTVGRKVTATVQWALAARLVPQGLVPLPLST
jgi:hypothetical protein